MKFRAQAERSVFFIWIITSDIVTKHDASYNAIHQGVTALEKMTRFIFKTDALSFILIGFIYDY